MAETQVHRPPRSAEDGCSVVATQTDRPTGVGAAPGESAERLSRRLSEAQSAFAVALVLLVALATGAAIGYAALVRHYQGRLAEQTTVAEQAQAQWAQARRDLDSMRVATGRMEADLRASQDAASALKDRLEDVERRFGVFRADSAARLNDVQKLNDALTNQLTTVTGEKDILAARVRSTERSLGDLQSDLQSETALRQTMAVQFEERVLAMGHQVNRLRRNLFEVHQRHDRERQTWRDRLAEEERKRLQLHAGLEGAGTALTELQNQAANLSATLAALLTYAGAPAADVPAEDGVTTQEDPGRDDSPKGDGS